MPIEHYEDLPYICHEAIYQYIYKDNASLIQNLPRKHRKRKQKRPYRNPNRAILNRISILDRPPGVLDRETFGHWESDSLEASGRQQGLNVLVERKSRMVHLSWLGSKKSKDTAKAIIRRLSRHPRAFVKTITYDNGPENARHLGVNAVLNAKSYFCQPYHSWEKGSVEQTISLVRRFIPKRSTFEHHSKRDVYRIELFLNNRPRKCLNFKTPYEAFRENLVHFPKRAFYPSELYIWRGI